MLRAYPRCNQQTAIQFLDYPRTPPVPRRRDPDQQRAEFATQYRYHVLDRGIRHVYIKPATARLNGKVERSHRIDEEEFYRMLDGVRIDDTVSACLGAVHCTFAVSIGPSRARSVR